MKAFQLCRLQCRRPQTSTEIRDQKRVRFRGFCIVLMLSMFASVLVELPPVPQMRITRSAARRLNLTLTTAGAVHSTTKGSDTASSRQFMELSRAATSIIRSRRKRLRENLTTELPAAQAVPELIAEPDSQNQANGTAHPTNSEVDAMGSEPPAGKRRFAFRPKPSLQVKFDKLTPLDARASYLNQPIVCNRVDLRVAPPRAPVQTQQRGSASQGSSDTYAARAQEASIATPAHKGPALPLGWHCGCCTAITLLRAGAHVLFPTTMWLLLLISCCCYLVAAAAAASAAAAAAAAAAVAGCGCGCGCSGCDCEPAAALLPLCCGGWGGCCC